MNNDIKRILALFKPYRGRLVLSLLCALAVIASRLLIPVFSGKAIDFLLDSSSMVPELAGILICLLAEGLSQYLLSRLNQRMIFSISSDLRKQSFKKIHHLPVSTLDRTPSGAIVNTLIQDIDSFGDGLLNSLTQLFTGILSIVGTVVIMLNINLKVGLVVILLTPLTILLSRKLGKYIQKFLKENNENRSKENAFTNEMMSNIKLLKAANYQQQACDSFNQIDRQYQRSSLKSVYISSLVNPTTRLMSNLVYAATALIASLAALQGLISIGDISVFLNYASQYGKPFNEIANVIGELQNAIQCSQRIFSFLDQEEMVEDEPIQAFKAEGNLVFKEVGFGYDEKTPLFENFNLEVSKGQHIAIVGPTGAGKTTLVNLLMRFYDIQKGQIRFDGTDIKTIQRNALRDNFAMVLQDSVLFKGTVYENIVFGKDDVSFNDVVEAAKKAHAHGFISRMANGYETMIDENGSNLSQGEKQLLCIARLMLRNPAVLILDEATSSIDTRTEMLIQSAFHTMMQGRTGFIIAHRLSTIKDADQIVVMNHGHIEEIGTHEQLLKKKGFYWQLYHSQFESFDSES